MIVYLSNGIQDSNAEPLMWLENTLDGDKNDAFYNLFDLSATPEESVRRREEITGTKPQFAYGFNLERIP